MSSNFLIFSFICAGTLSSLTAGAQSSFTDLKATAALDIVSPVLSSQDSGYKVDIRSVEFMLYSPVDHLFDGMVNFAGHTEGRNFIWGVHEAYVGSSKLIARSRFRAGKFFLGIGRLNQFHQHDWPFIKAPKAHAKFFAEEGTADTGIEYAYLLPTQQFIELNLGITNGYCYGHCHDGDGQKPPRPLVYAHPTIFFERENGGALLGLTYVNREDSSLGVTHLVGADFTYKRRKAKVLEWLIQTELYFEDQGLSKRTKNLGGYLLAQYGLDQSWSASLRLDGYSHLNKTFETTGESRGDFDYAIVPTITYKSSEFSTLRLGYTYSVETTGGESDKKDHLVQLQFGFILGAHPAHDF
jgi:hypothetical protein